MKPEKRSAPPLADTLEALLPTPRETALLRACLLPGPDGRAAWTAWSSAEGGLAAALADDGEALKGLLPLLYRRLKLNSVQLEPAEATVLRSADLREELRGEAYYQVCRELLRALSDAVTPAILLKGAALGALVYPERLARHSRDVDVLLHEADLGSAADALRLAGLQRLSEAASTSTDLETRHASGLVVKLHSRPFRLPHANQLSSELWARSRPTDIFGEPVRVLSPSDSLLHVCAQAAVWPGRESLRWACDAWFVLQSTSSVDWTVFVDSARHGQLALPIYVLLRYLSTELQAPVPRPTLDSLEDAAGQARTLERENALYGARLEPRVTYRCLLRRSRNWRSRASVLRWMVAPSPAYVRWTRRVSRAWLLPAYYVHRPMRYVVRRLRWWLAGRQERAAGGADAGG